VDELLRTARRKADKTQTEVAKEIGVTQPTISDWESGETHPRPEYWLRIADAYAVPVARLKAAAVSRMMTAASGSKGAA
jgi:transcriptional regulator with XRE-family HTH domain